MTAMQAWLSDGAPWWDRCTCQHYRWTHTSGSCDRLHDGGKPCRCKAFAGVSGDGRGETP